MVFGKCSMFSSARNFRILLQSVELLPHENSLDLHAADLLNHLSLRLTWVTAVTLTADYCESGGGADNVFVAPFKLLLVNNGH